jgi:hypothetical protein
MGKLGLTINEAKTSLRNARQERFDFLGYSFGRIGLRRTGIGIWARARPRTCATAQDKDRRSSGAEQYRTTAGSAGQAQ